MKQKKIFRKKRLKKSFTFNHNFPFVSLGFTALSVKFYFDDRINSRANKLFSIYPVNFRLSFFPLRYFEFGLFCHIDYENMVYRYLDEGEYEYFDSKLIFSYGLFLGLSLFYEKNHYSLGVQVYNLFYDLPEKKDWRKTNDVNGYFLPQIGVYQKLDFKIYKILYFFYIF